MYPRKKSFQGEELNRVEQLPGQEAANGLVGVLVEGIGAKKLLLLSYQNHEGKHQQIEPNVDPQVLWPKPRKEMK